MRQHGLELEAKFWDLGKQIHGVVAITDHGVTSGFFFMPKLPRSLAPYFAPGTSASQVSAEAFVLGADTVVILGQQILGKPADAACARAMLARLSDRTHQVATAYTREYYFFQDDLGPLEPYRRSLKTVQ